MIYKFKSKDKGLMVFKDGSVVATFVKGLFETDNLTLASFLVQLEEVTCLTPFVQETPEIPPNSDKPIEPIILEVPKEVKEVKAEVKKVTKK